MRPALLLGLALALALGACGKKAPLRVPEGREADFTYPQSYPAPRSVVPTSALEGPESTLPAPAATTTDISPMPQDERRTRTRIYGAE